MSIGSHVQKFAYANSPSSRRRCLRTVYHSDLVFRGFTLIELLVTLAVLTISLTIAMPLVTSQVEKQKIIGVAETLTKDMYRARAESLRRNQDVVVSFDIGTGATPPPWCYGLNVTAACDCTTADSCQLDVEEVRKGGDQVGASFPDVFLDSVSFSSDDLIFTPARGLANGGTVTISSKDGDSEDEWRLAVVVSTLGRIRICSPAGSYEKIGRYDPCS